MDEETFDRLVEQAKVFYELSLEYLVSPEVLFQLGIIAVAVIPAWFLSGFVEKKIEGAERRIHEMRGLLRFWIDDPQRGLTNIRGTVLLALWDTFKEHDINIPFPHREVIMRTPVTVDQEKGEGPALVHCLVLIDDMRAPQRTRNKAQTAEHSCAVFKVWNAVAGSLRGSLRASREAAICGVALS